MTFVRTRFAPMIASALLGFAALAAPAPAFADPVAPVASEWANPKNSVHIRAEQCGRNLCGVVTWASDKAQADARRGGTTNLVGTTIFRDLKPTGGNSWRGKVYVPDINQTFAGTLTFNGNNTMEGKGCVLFGLVCKTQTWTRIK